MDAVGTVVRIPAFRARPLVASSRNANSINSVLPSAASARCKIGERYIYIRSECPSWRTVTATAHPRHSYPI